MENLVVLNYSSVVFKDQERFEPREIGVSKVSDYVWMASNESIQEEPSYLEELLFTATSQWELPEEFRLKRFKGVHFCLWHAPQHEKPIPLISNVADANIIIKAYQKRWSVECLFKDLKSTSFKLHKTRLTCAKAIHNLVMIAAFAFTLVLKLGKMYKDHPIRGYIHQVRPDQVVCSIFNLGLQLLDFFLERDIDFCFDHLVPISIAELKQRHKNL